MATLGDRITVDPDSAAVAPAFAACASALAMSSTCSPTGSVLSRSPRSCRIWSRRIFRRACGSPAGAWPTRSQSHDHLAGRSTAPFRCGVDHRDVWDRGARGPRLGLRDAKDPPIFQAARAADAVVMTKDSDFVEMLHRLGPPPKVLWVTCGNTSNAQLREILSRQLPTAVARWRRGRTWSRSRTFHGTRPTSCPPRRWGRFGFSPS